MAHASLGRRLGAAVLSLAAILPAGPAGSQYPVIDQTAIARLTDQLNKLQEQIDKLNAIRDGVQEQINAIGALGQIAIPMVNMTRLQRQLQRDSQCLLPDWSKLLPDVEFDDIDFDSLCEAGNAYRQTLWVNAAESEQWAMPERREARERVDERRLNILVDTTSKGLAQADMAARAAIDLSDAAGELDASATAAVDMNDRLAVIAQGQVLNARAMAQLIQVQSQLLKVQSIAVLNEAAPPASELLDEEGGGEGQP